jgi:aryl-alcohol dehydrogenase-like predicted oxidoreductase
MTAYGVLSRGLISGHWTKDQGKAQGDFRAYSPRFQGDNVDKNLALVEALREVAEAKGVSVAQIAIAWVAAQGRRHRAAGRRPHPRAPGRVAGRAGRDLSADDLAAIERGRAQGRGGRASATPKPRWPTSTASAPMATGPRSS